jgi:hypothetical protein
MEKETAGRAGASNAEALAPTARKRERKVRMNRD